MAKLLDVKKQTNNKYLNIYDAKFLNEETGKQFNYYIASRKDERELTCKTKDHTTCDAVMIIPKFTNGDIIMIRQFRAPINDYIYEFPSGLVDDGETIEEAIKRELYEETGLNIISHEVMIKPSYTSAGMSDESVAIAEAIVDGEISLRNKEENEDIEVIILKPGDINTFLSNNLVAIKASMYLTLI